MLRLWAAGYLSKGYAQFSASPLADDATMPEVRTDLRRLHPQGGDARGDDVTGRYAPPAAMRASWAFAAFSWACRFVLLTTGSPARRESMCTCCLVR